MRDPIRRLKSYAIGSVVLFAACSPEKPPTAVKAPPLFDVSAIPQGYVFTPAGWYHQSCVYEVPNKAFLDQGNVVRPLNGAPYRVPDCAYPTYSSRGGLHPPDGAPNWLEYDSVTAGAGNVYSGVSAHWAVPGLPQGAYTQSPQQVYYTFPGLQTTAEDKVFQPILTYGYAPGYGGNFWTLASWICRANGNCIHSPAISVSPGDSIQGFVNNFLQCSGGLCSWQIQGFDANTNQGVGITTSDSNNLTFATGGAVEEYGLNTCNQFPVNGIFFVDDSVLNQSGNPITPSWAGTVRQNPSPSCSFSVHFTSTTTSLYHNPATPLTVAPISGPTYVQVGDYCVWSGAANGGSLPYTYQWSGVVNGNTGSYNVIGGTTVSSDHLTLTVTSFDGQTASTTLSIYEDSSAPLCSGA